MTFAVEFARRGARRLPLGARQRLQHLKWALAGPAVPNPLETFFREREHRLIHKWVHYFEIYHRHLARFRGKDVVIVEFGVSHGGSLQMWRDYFGRDAKIFGVDIDRRCKKFEGPGVEIFIGDQEDRAFLRQIGDRIGRPIDVLIDDGGHTVGQQIATFEEIYPRMARRGVFLIEDLHTNYWDEYGGGYLRPGTFIEYAKVLVDQLGAWHSRDDDLRVNKFTRSTRSMHFYDSIIVFERGRVVAPHHEMKGTPSLQG